MAKLENRYIRIEDWKGNVYYPDSSTETSTAGTISGEAGTEPGSDPYTEGQYISDPAASGGKSIMVTSSSNRTTIYKASFSSLKFGKITIGSRFKSNIFTGDVGILEVNSYYRDSSGTTPVDTKIDTCTVTGKDIGVANTYITLPHTIEYFGTATGSTSLVVEIIVLPDTGATVWFDYMYVAMETGTSSPGGKREVYVDGTVVVVGD